MAAEKCTTWQPVDLIQISVFNQGKTIGEEGCFAAVPPRQRLPERSSPGVSPCFLSGSSRRRGSHAVKDFGGKQLQHHRQMVGKLGNSEGR